ncbi:chorismate mutase [Allostreptomyces psammosilenae]|uniref:Chorismate mutase n=1 Tax=Allostreptomyces psammosilenae TaxID=1892865 RepID=A0A852ZUA8_9ACTN|nr:chorismate mutase [Allostreptomyces psammosilenae]NYI05976.1 chorismate mutase [Allostreptomyces psammosilenae]
MSSGGIAGAAAPATGPGSDSTAATAATVVAPAAEVTPAAGAPDAGTARPADAADVADPADVAEVIGAARGRIDDLDRRIIALVRERMEASAEVQRARMASGGRRVELSREMEIISRYREGLGKPGTTVAMTLLELCRGKV